MNDLDFSDFAEPVGGSADLSWEDVGDRWDDIGAPVGKPIPELPADDGNLLDAAGDLGASFFQGANALLGAGGTLYGLATGHTENWATKEAATRREYWQGKKSTYLKAAEERRAAIIAQPGNEFQKAGRAIWETATDPALLASYMAEQITSFLPGGAAGKAAGAAAKSAGYGVKAQALTGLGAAASVGAVQQGADAAGGTIDELSRLPDVFWSENPEVMLLVEDGVPFEVARDQVMNNLAKDTFKASAVVSLATNLIPGALSVEKALTGVKAVAGSRLVNAAKGAAGEALQEGIEEGSGAYATGYNVNKIDPSRDPFDGVGEATGMGLLAGTFGLISGALEKGPGKRVKDVGEDVLNAAGVDEAIARAERTLMDVVNAGRPGPPPAGPAAAGALEAEPIIVGEGEGEPIYDYGSSQVAIPPILGQAIRGSAAQAIDPNDLYAPEGGFEDNPHITIKYGWDEGNGPAVQEALADAGPVEVEIQGITVFEGNPDYDVVVMQVEGAGLNALRQRIESVVDAPGDSFPEYQPHITLAYVKKGMGKKYAKTEIGVEGARLTFDKIQVTGRDGSVLEVPLTGTESVPFRTAQAQPKPVIYADPRLKRDEYRNALTQMGDELYSRQDQGSLNVMAQDDPKGEGFRVQSMNPKWFQRMAEAYRNDGANVSVDYVRNVITKAMEGQAPLANRQQSVLTSLLDHVTEARLQPGNEGNWTVIEARKKLEIERDKRRIARQSGPELPIEISAEQADLYSSLGERYEEGSYPADWDFDHRALFDMVQVAEEAGIDVDAVLLEAADSGASTESTLESFEALLDEMYGPDEPTEQASLTADQGSEPAEGGIDSQSNPQTAVEEPDGGQAATVAPEEVTGQKPKKTDLSAERKALSGIRLKERVEEAETGEIMEVEVSALASWAILRQRIKAAERVLECSRK